MPVEVILPKVDMDMSHGTLSTWHVAEGELVQKGAPLFDIETDKAAMEVEAPETGYLRRIAAQPGDKVAVGTTIAWLYAEGEAFALQPATVPAASASPSPSPAVAPHATEVILPKVDMDMSHGMFAVWHAAEGDLVKQGAPLFDIETDKAAMEVEAPATGRLHHIAAKPGDKIAVGAIVAWIYPEGMVVSLPPAPVGARQNLVRSKRLFRFRLPTWRNRSQLWQNVRHPPHARRHETLGWPCQRSRVLARSAGFNTTT